MHNGAPQRLWKVVVFHRTKWEGKKKELFYSCCSRVKTKAVIIPEKQKRKKKTIIIILHCRTTDCPNVGRNLPVKMLSVGETANSLISLVSALTPSKRPEIVHLTGSDAQLHMCRHPSVSWWEGNLIN